MLTRMLRTRRSACERVGFSEVETALARFLEMIPADNMLAFFEHIFGI